MPKDPVYSIENAPRVRLAPSPTGGLHIGTARTALFNWLYARKHGGTFVLRIEDTDTKRSTKEYEQAIIADLRWLGLIWDEGVEAKGKLGPYRQTERAELYRRYVMQLLANEQAYYCYCTPEQLEQDRKVAQREGKPPIYVGRCCTVTSAEHIEKQKRKVRSVVRFKTPREPIEVRDEIRGVLKFHGNDFGDFVIAKPDGSPLFLLANVIDDALMKITLVIRGEDHLPNLPKQIFLAKALGFTSPKYAHLPLILNPDRSKMSKRAGPTHVGEYRKLGYLPEAIINYIALLGWNPGTTQEIFTQPALIEAFNVRQINKAGSVFDIKRLQWMNSQYLRGLSTADLAKLAEPFWPKSAKGASTKLKERALVTVKDRLTHLAELSLLSEVFFTKKVTIDPKLLKWKKSTLEESIAGLKATRAWLAELPETVFSTAHGLEEELKKFVADKNLSVGGVFWPLRVALTGQKNSPGPQELMWVFGKKKTLERVDAALANL